MVNTKCDTSYYDSRGYQRKIFDGNVLYESKAKAMKGSDWKPQVQRFNMTYLLELSKMQRDLENMEYEFLPTTNFTLHERGKLRRITGEQVQDRIVKHALCDEVLNPLIEPHLIYDNGASVVGKGIAFTRKRLLTHLRKYYAQVGAYSQKSNAENMMAKLKAAGYDAFITTKSGIAAGTAKKSAAEIAKEIYNGTCSDARWSSWGNGADRVNRLKQAGYDPSEVQSEVNKLF